MASVAYNIVIGFALPHQLAIKLGKTACVSLHTCEQLVLCGGAACCVGSVMAWRRLDTLPLWLQMAVRHYLSQDDRSAASVAATTPLSKHVAYKLDYW